MDCKGVAAIPQAKRRKFVPPVTPQDIVTPADALLRVLALPLDQQPRAAGPGTALEPGLPATEFKIWKRLYQVLRLPDRQQPPAALSTLCPWGYSWWFEHRHADLESHERRLASLESLAVEGGSK